MTASIPAKHRGAPYVVDRRGKAHYVLKRMVGHQEHAIYMTRTDVINVANALVDLVESNATA